MNLASVLFWTLAATIAGIVLMVLIAGVRGTLQYTGQRLAEGLFPLLFEHIAMARKPDFIVGEVRDPYLLRWWILPRNRVFNVYLHCFMRSDDDRALHDHPWHSLSLMLEGQVVEHSIDAAGKRSALWMRAGAWRLRSAKYAHRLELPPGVVCWTLFFTGPVVRTWGFHCPKGWVRWDVFTETTPGRSVTGRGCD